VEVCVADECFSVLPNAKAFNLTLILESLDPKAPQPLFARLRNGNREKKIPLRSQRRFPNGKSCPAECIAFDASFPGDSKR
jgi:hypothetical protein